MCVIVLMSYMFLAVVCVPHLHSDVPLLRMLHPSVTVVCAFVLLAVVASAPVVARVLVLVLLLFLSNAMMFTRLGAAPPHVLRLVLAILSRPDFLKL